MPDAGRGKLFVISGPSGAGKSTIVSRLKGIEGVFYSVSATTRPPRTGEVDGKDYRFVSREEFEDMVERAEFAEYAEVAGNLYGTPSAPLADALAAGRTAVVDIDVQGAMQIKDKFPEARLVFIRPPSMEVLERRLRDRRTDSEEVIRRRLSIAAREMEYASRYDYQIVNDELDKAVNRTLDLIRT